MANIGFGITFIIFGLIVITQPVLHGPLFYQYDFDLRGFNIPLGILMIIFGLGFIWTSLTSRK
jgi:hypothetical protein